MPENGHQPFEFKCQFAGWGLFVLSALFFTAASLRSGDALAIAGSLLFLVACFVFLLPMVLYLKARGEKPAAEPSGKAVPVIPGSRPSTEEAFASTGRGGACQNDREAGTGG